VDRHIELSSIIQGAMSTLKASMYISMPAAIVDYNPATQTADVQPMLNDPRENLSAEEVYFEPWGIIQNVPVAWPRMGGYVIAGFLKPMDQVVLEAFDLDPTAWRAQGRSLQPVNPGDLRRLGGQHWRVNPTDLTGSQTAGVNKSAPTVPSLVIGLDGGLPLITITGTTIQLGEGATSYVALATLVAAELSKIAMAFSTFVPGTGGASFPHPYTTPGNVAATITKAL
jgi:protein gp138